MYFHRLLGLAFCGALLGGCAIHPVPENVTRLRTADIVESIRCETRLAIADKAADLIEAETTYTTDRARRAAIVQYLRKNAARLDRQFIAKALSSSRVEREFYDKYIKSAVAYIFTFDISETNSVGANADPFFAITGGTAGIALGAQSQLQRDNIRRFALTETFGDALFDPRLDCPSAYAAENFSYPISGRIGMTEVISTFIDLNQGRTLIAPEEGKTDAFSDTLEFTTTVSASATPRIFLAGIGNRPALTQTNFGLSAQRIDKHKVIVGLSTPIAGPVGRGFAAPLGAPDPNPLKTPQEQRALNAAARQPIQTLIERTTSAIRLQ